MVRRRFLDCLFAGDGSADDFITQSFQSPLNVQRDDSFVFNNKYPYFLHRSILLLTPALIR